MNTQSDRGNEPDLETAPIESRSSGLSIESLAAEEQVGNTTEDFNASELRANLKARTAGYLAISIWVVISIIVIIHIGSVTWLWSHLPSLIDSTNDGVEQLERASKSIDEIAKTLYTFLGTLATAITGYYFNESAAARRDDSAD